MEKDKLDLLSILWEYKGRIIGIMFGIVLGIIYLLLGIWKALIFSLIVIMCYILGRLLDQPKDTLRELLSRVFPPKE